jgi:hypothetical protein
VAFKTKHRDDGIAHVGFHRNLRSRSVSTQ